MAAFLRLENLGCVQWVSLVAEVKTWPFRRILRTVGMKGIEERIGATQGNGVHAAETPLAKEPSLTPPLSLPLPASFARILVVGAGGFGREVLQWARDAWPDETARISGFLSADAHIFASHADDPAVLGDPATFSPRAGDGLLLAIGIPGVRRKVAESLLARGASFLTLVHPTAVIAATAEIGTGSIICPHAVVSDTARLGRFTLVNYHASTAHDAATGDFAVLSPYSTLGGGAAVAEDVFLGLHASVGPGISVGQRSKVAANSCALADVPPDSLVHGVPGRISPLLAPA